MKLPKRRIALTTIFLLLVGSCFVAVAQADSNNTTNETETEVVDESIIQINENLAYSDVKADRERMEITFHNPNDRPLTITIVDAGSGFQGGEYDRRTVRLLPGETTIEQSVTPVSGAVLVNVDDGETLYGIYRQVDSSDLIGPPWGASDAQAAAIGTAVSISAITLSIAWRRLRGSSEEVELLG